MTALLTVRGLSKSFAGTQALDQVDLTVHSGEIVALLGQNGCGKSTLVKVLAGVYRADGGEVVTHRPPGASALPSLHVIHQDLGLVETLSTVENLALGRDPGLLRPLRTRREVAHARQLIAGFGVEFDVLLPIRALSPVQRTVVAIARAIDGWTSRTNVLVLDEPTAALHGHEVDILFSVVRRLAREGAGVIFVSHRLDEVRELADRLVVLRDGRVAADRDAEGVSTEELAELITGAAPALRARPRSRISGLGAHGLDSPALSLRGLRGPTIRSIDFDLMPGEIVGLAGALGSGRDEVASLVFGAVPVAGGTVAVAGTTVGRPTPRGSVRRGLAYVPADRRSRGAVLSLTLRENVALPGLRGLSAARIHLRRRHERTEVATWIDRLDIRPGHPEKRLELFSGGNQQKAVLAKWLRLRPDVLLLDEPTQGVDIGASRSIRRLLRSAAADGMAVLIASSDNADLVGTCDRVLVMRDGVVACVLHGSDIDDHRITQECLGSHRAATAAAEENHV